MSFEVVGDFKKNPRTFPMLFGDHDCNVIIFTIHVF
jgi:hypothetical protein